MAALFDGLVFSSEFKVAKLPPKGEALQKIKSKGYADKYRAHVEPIDLINLEFNKASRHMVGFEVETIHF